MHGLDDDNASFLVIIEKLDTFVAIIFHDLINLPQKLDLSRDWS